MASNYMKYSCSTKIIASNYMISKDRSIIKKKLENERLKVKGVSLENNEYY